MLTFRSPAYIDSITKQPEDAPLNNEDLSPIMDSMYQVAIEEMVEKAFSAADVNNDGKITYEEFRYLRSTHTHSKLASLTPRGWEMQGLGAAGPYHDLLAGGPRLRLLE